MANTFYVDPSGEIEMMKSMSPKNMPQMLKSKPMSQADMCKQGKACMDAAKMSAKGGGSMG